MDKRCPLLIGTDCDKHCRGERCAWWVSYTKGCAIRDIALEMIAWRQERAWEAEDAEK
jgi:hypothetical protein